MVAASLLQVATPPVEAYQPGPPPAQENQAPAPARKAEPGPPRAESEATRAARQGPAAVNWPQPGAVELTVGTSGTDRSAPVKAGGLAVAAASPQAKKSARAGRDPSSPTRMRVETLARDVSDRARVDGPVVKLSRRDGTAADAKVEVTLSYEGIEHAYGGDFGARLRLVRLPDCALTTPGAAGCAAEPIETINDAESKTLTATVTVGATGAVYAMTAQEASSQGDFGATALSPSSTWNVSPSSGGFNWSYPLRVPPVPGGAAPSIALSYNSQTVDGRTASTNNQGSWLGEGFSYEPGYVERQYKPCVDDGHDGVGDLCWSHENVTLMLNGRASELVQDGSSWRFASDDGSKIEKLTDSANGNGARSGEHWKVTTVDGTEYFFGLNRLPGWSSGKTETASVFKVPVYGDDPGEPCYNSNFADAYCYQGWRWNLDYVKDRLGNVISYYYKQEENYYARGAKLDVNGVAYHRGGWLQRVEYGQRHNQVYSTSPVARIVFGTAERCLPTSTMACGEGDLTKDTAPHWPDVPWDRICVQNTKCTSSQASPSFWTRKRVVSINSEIRSGSGWSPVESWNLEHLFTNNGDGSRSLWLHKIVHVGKYGSGSAISMPSVQLESVQLPNRIDVPGDNILPLVRPRMNTVYTDSGSQISIRYAEPDCFADNLPTPGNSTRRCYPVRWDAEGSGTVTDWFHKYVVESISESDRTTVEPGTVIAPEMVTAYEYLGGAAWRRSDPNGITEAEDLTWNQWRGYEKVRVRRGTDELKKTLSEHTYLRGMHGDALPGGGTRSVTRTDSEGTSYTDHDELAGFEIETRVYDGDRVISKSIKSPWRYRTASKTWSWGTDEAYFVKPATVRGFTRLESDGWRETKTITTYDPKTSAYQDPVGRVTQVEDLGDVATAADDRCTRTTYADNHSLRLRNLVAREETVAVSCSATPDRRTQLLVDNRTSYDGLAFGATPVAGNATRVEKLAEHDGSSASYVTVATATFDQFGRPTTASDGSGAVTDIAYTETNGLTTKKVETGPPVTVGTSEVRFVASTEYSPAWGKPTAQIDWNGKRTDVVYDKLGRVLHVWLPDRPKASTADKPSVRYTYAVQDRIPVSVKTEKLNVAGGYDASYEIYDGFLRIRQTQEPGPDGNRIVAETFYTATGQIDKVNDVFYVLGAPSGELLKTVNGDTDLQTKYVYDGADRVTSTITLVAGQEKWRTVTRYGGDRTHVDPPAGGTPTTVITDVREQPLYLRQYKGAEPTGEYDQTAYTYTAAGQPATVTDPAGNVWSHEYDQRGRKTSTTDPDTGTTTFEYNDYDQLVSTVDAEGNRLSYTYDVLGRKTATYRNTVASGEKLAEWRYDTVAKGHLYSTTRYANNLQYRIFYSTRDAMYRVTETRYSIPKTSDTDPLAGTYRFFTNYNSDGTVRGLGLPAAGGLPQESVAYSYDNLQRITAISGHQNYVTATVYSNTGQLTRAELNTGGRKLWANYYYDEGTNRLNRSILTRETIVVPGQPAPDDPVSDIDQRYSYDDAGNVLSIVDNPGSGQRDAQCFGYDYLRRMTEAWTSASTAAEPCVGTPDSTGVGGVAPYHHSYSYDVTGNRKTETLHAVAGSDEVTREYRYPNPGQPQPHTLTSVVETTTAGDRLYEYEYDAKGNTVQRTEIGEEQDLSWDAEGHLASVTKAGQTTSFVYDADGNRLVRKEPNATTVYLMGMELRLNHANQVVDGTRYYPVNGSLMVVRTIMGVQFQAADHHGTGQAAVDAVTGQLSYRRTTPFGSPRGAQPADGDWYGEKGFVGGTVDKSTGLTHLGAREYDPAIGRFISVDPLIDYADPQQMHGFAYANNSPVSFTDPDGLKPLATVGGGAEEEKYWKDNDQKLVQNSAGKWTVVRHVWPTPSEPGPVIDARNEVNRAKQDIEAVAKELGQILMDELGITDALDCFINGDLGACGATALNIAAAAVGGAAGKLIAKYGLRWKKGAELIGRLKDLGKRLYKRVGDYFAARKRLKQAEADCLKKGNSFEPGTLVLLADGSAKPIEDVKVGDAVMATDPEGGVTAPKTVVATIIGQGVKSLVEITVDVDGDRGDAEGSLVATDGHPFWVPELHEWLDASELEVGQWLQTSAGTFVQISALSRSSETAQVHNLTVDDVHTYYVLAGDTSVLVHNCNRSGLDFTDAEREKVYEANRQANGGVLKCEYCGGDVVRRPSRSGVPGKPDDAQIDHVEPRASGGHGGAHNGAVACRRCNRDKSTKTLEEWDNELRELLDDE
ncbi:polymorphic toxin-type HINT domain-containing protein [Melissospora conviva]|uniref:polymorphic toxin-type HINT domain-containing protein n=1 Tax=Melissospora conviva TaxID=3388432 RepID=UPI003F813FA5